MTKFSLSPISVVYPVVLLDRTEAEPRTFRKGSALLTYFIPYSLAPASSSILTITSLSA